MILDIEYNFVQVATEKIEIEDISNISLRISNEQNHEWYILIQTSLGVTSIEEFGPTVPDLNTKLNGFMYKYSGPMDYNEEKIATRLEKFVQDPKKAIFKVEQITPEEFLLILKDLMF